MNGFSCAIGPHPALPRDEGGTRGQALIETAITLPIMIILFLGFLAVGVAVQGAVDLNTAVYLATASAVTAPAGEKGMKTGHAYAHDTYAYTIGHFTYLADSGKSISCTGNWAPGTQVTCTAAARVRLTSTFAIVPDLPLTATATATVPAYRSAPIPP